MKYIIYDKYDSALNPQGLLSTTKALFAALNLEVISPASLQHKVCLIAVGIGLD
ncbi:hypothetical protein [Helicobacter typhlonius]|uniref:hypothetical protein n=1 Tax=Helicobacter typhlonius TaxID=76936 RepID=UPI002FE0813E